MICQSRDSLLAWEMGSGISSPGLVHKDEATQAMRSPNSGSESRKAIMLHSVTMLRTASRGLVLPRATHDEAPRLPWAVQVCVDEL